MLNHLADIVVSELAAGRWQGAAIRAAGAARTLRFMRQYRELSDLDIVRLYIATQDSRDVLFHLSHRHYLSTRLSPGQRIQWALTHYKYEARTHTTPYKQAVYGKGGIPLWSATVCGTTYTIRLRAATPPRNEGGMSVLLEAGQVCLHETAYVWVEGESIGAGVEVLPLITRNQSVRPRADELIRFRQDFPQNSPSYFCLAAMHGIAMGHDHRFLAGLRHDWQIAFDERLSESFRNSYTEFWKKFGGREIAGHAYLMPVPPDHPPLSQVPSKHRTRAHDRRQNWRMIADDAAAAIAEHRLR
jgi:uncharacterized protein VirK/YbjX